MRDNTHTLAIHRVEGRKAAMRKVIESLGGVCYKRYRIYAKQLVH